MHALKAGVYYRTLLYPVRHLESPVRRHSGIAELLSAQGYATGIWGKWHLGSKEGRFATNQGFDEWYGIPRSYDESMWPSLNNVQGMWPAVGDKQSWDEKLIPAEPIHEARRGEKARQVGEVNVDTARRSSAARPIPMFRRN